MKKSFIILGVLAALVVLVLGTTVNAGEQHVVVVEENEQLIHSNDSLCAENNRLVKENGDLKAINKGLVAKLETSKSNDSLEKELETKRKDAAEKEYLIALFSLEKIVKEELTWISPEAAYQALNEKLPRKPTLEEYENALEDMIIKDLLYHYVEPDPYMKGKKVHRKEIKSIIKDIYN